jgi:ATP adenylyltransferase/5',5'''-P-1,P-4-tetraphosphate phosphorylase II
MFKALALAVDSLFESQLKEWELALKNYTGLQHIKVKSIVMKGFEVWVQYNSARIISSTAKVDPQSISKRPCFLCGNNRPIQQQSITYKNDFEILVNPYPVFQRHLTIPTIQHQPQYIPGKFGIMLQLAKDLPQFTIIYNGPNCGASAPDHFHFQAIPRGVLPIEYDFSAENNCRFEGEINKMEIFTWDHYLRKIITIRGIDSATIEGIFRTLLGLLGAIFPSDDEPMINILAAYDRNKWIVHVFPRKGHRPAQFFESGEKQIITSPGSIDLGGMVVMSREEDFNKITTADIASIFEQVCVEDTLIRYLVQKLF